MVHIMDVGSGDGPELTKRTGDMNQTSSTDAPLKINGNSIHLRAAVFFSCIGGFLFGYDTGIISGAMLLMKSEFNLSIFEQSAIVTVTILGAWLFSLVAGYSADRLGRKNIILISSVIFTVGSLVMGFAQTSAFLIAGRFILGVAIGLSSSTIPVYLAEITQSHQRGTLVANFNLLITAGQLGSGVIAGLFSTYHEGWRHMINLGAIPSALQAIYFLFAYESPRFLLKIGKEKEAYQSLKSFRSDEALMQIEFEQIKEYLAQQERENKRMRSSGVFEVLKQVRIDIALRRALVLGCVLQLVQQLAGINTIMYYTATIIQQAGIADKSLAIWLASLTGLVNFVLTFAGLWFVDRVGRRKLLLGSVIGVCVSLLFLSGSFYVARSTAPAVTEVADLNSTCSLINSCNSCVRSPECGFCFAGKGEEMLSTCLPFNENDPDHSLGGWCSADYDPLSGDVTWLIGDGNLAAGNETLLPLNETLLVGNETRLVGNETRLVGNETLPMNETLPIRNRTLLAGQPTFAANNCPSDYSYLIVAGLLFYLVAFSCGLGPQVWILNSEIFPLSHRSACFSLGVACNWLSNTLVSLTFLYFIEWLTETGAFLIYFSFALAGCIYFWAYLPETKGKKLEEIEQLFQPERPVDRPTEMTSKE